MSPCRRRHASGAERGRSEAQCLPRHGHLQSAQAGQRVEHRQLLEIARDRIVLTPAKLKIDEPEDTDLDEEPEEPHLVGDVSLAELLAEPLEMLATQSRTSVTTP